MRALVGIQAQDRAAARLAVAVRAGGEGPMAGAEATGHDGLAAGDEAPGHDGLAAGDEAPGHAGVVAGDEPPFAPGIVRTWAMRGTLHLVAADDVPLMLAIFGPLHLARGHRRLTELGLPPELAERSTAETAAILAEEAPLTRHELAARLRERGVPVEAAGQAPIHVVRRAALSGVLVEVGVRGREELYGPIAQKPLPDRDEALVELARRYAAAHAPATAEDLAAWSGLPAADVRRSWEEPEPPAGEPEPGPVRLLPAFDEWLLGWASRDAVLPRQHAGRVLRGGIIRPVAIADGRVFATWRRRDRRIELEPLGRMTRAMREGVEAAAARLGFDA